MTKNSLVNSDSQPTTPQQPTQSASLASAPGGVDEWLRLAIEDSDSYWWQIELPTNRLHYSPNTERILGRPPAPTLAGNLMYVHPDDQALPAQALQEAIQTGRDQFSYQVRSVALADQLRWFEVSGSIRRDSQGQPRMVIGRAQNITATKIAQAEAHLSQARATFLLQLSDTLRSLADPVALQITATRLTLEYFGADRAYYCEIQGDQVSVRQHAARPDLPPIPPAYSLAQFPSMKALLLAGKPVVVSEASTNDLIDQALKQLCGRLKIGAYIQVPLIQQGQLVAKFCLTQDQPRNWTSLDIQLAAETAQRTWDVTQRARTEAALRQSEAKYRLLFDSIDEGFCLIQLLYDTQGQPIDWLYLEANPTFERQVGLSPIGQRVSQVVGPVETYWLDFYHRVVLSRQAARTENYVAALDRWYSVYASPVGTTADQLTVVFDDCSARKQLEAALRAADQRKDEFLAMLAHELRNPMAILHSTLALLNQPDGPPQGFALGQALTLMGREVAHLNRLVDDLLEVSRISQGKIELRLEPVDLVQLVQQSLAATHAEFGARGQILLSELSHQPLWVRGDATRLTQIVRNLLTNANKYTPQGGLIQVRLQRHEGHVILQVKDTGIGLSADQLETIFEAFVQVSTSLDRPQGGLGLGLGVVKQLVELHGGSVSVHSPGLGQGSEFIVRLARINTPPAGVALLPLGLAPSPPVRLLVVDDNADLARVTALVLTARHYQVHTCLSGQQALAAVESLQPDVVLLDLGMPEMDGYETCRRLRQLSWGQQGVIVALSGYGTEQDRKRTQAAGFDGHLLKPLVVEALEQLLLELLQPSATPVALPKKRPDESARQRAHDLRSAFSIIGTAVSRLREAPGEPERSELLAMVERNVNQAIQLVAALLS